MTVHLLSVICLMEWMTPATELTELVISETLEDTGMLCDM